MNSQRKMKDKTKKDAPLMKQILERSWSIGCMADMQSKSEGL